jgi:hypothetical protein
VDFLKINVYTVVFLVLIVDIVGEYNVGRMGFFVVAARGGSRI